jgi:hypothetical protein
MNKQKLISVLQSRIAKRRNYLADGWELFDDLKRDEDTEYDAYYFIVTLINVGKEQKVDKALLKLVQSPFDAGFAVGYQEACKAVKHTLEACECQN